MKCDICDNEFVDSMLGLTEMIFHMLIHHKPRDINKDDSPEWFPNCNDNKRMATINNWLAGRL